MKARMTLKAILATAPGLDPSAQLRKHSHSSLLALWLFYSLFQTFEISEEVVNIRLRELVEQFAMDCQRILQFNFHPFAQERPIPTGVVAQRNHKIIGVRQRTLDLLAGGQRHYRDGVLATGIKHAGFEIDGGVLGSDGGQIARGGMTAFAATGSIEIRLSGLRIAGEQLLDWIRTWDFPRSYPFDSTRVQICGYVQHLLVGHRHCGHAFIRAAETNDFANLVTLHVMSHKRRADKVRPPSTCGIRAMTESTRLLELFVSALDCRVLRNSLWPSRGIPQTKGKKDRCVKNCGFGKLSSTSKPILIHLHSSQSLIPRNVRRIFSCNSQPLKPKG